MTYQIDLRTRDELQIAIQSGGYVRYFIADREGYKWHVEEVCGAYISRHGAFYLADMFDYFRSVKKSLDIRGKGV